MKAKGSILYELAIVILTVLLVASILYPKKLIEQQEEYREISHHRMEEIQKAGLQFQKYHGYYTDTMAVLINFIRTSPEYEHYVDSMIVGGLDSIITKVQEFKTREEHIASLMHSATDSVMIDSLSRMQNDIKLDSRELAGYIEYVFDNMRSLPNMPVDQLRTVFVIVDSKQFTLNLDIVRNAIESGQQKVAEQAKNDAIKVFDSVIQKFEDVKAEVFKFKDDRLDEMAYCPVTNKEFRLVHVHSDTTAIKYLNIYSPIDSSDIESVEHDFLRSKIGGLKLQNYGKIENGKKSWEDG